MSILHNLVLIGVIAIAFAFFVPPIKGKTKKAVEWTKENEAALQAKHPPIASNELRKFGFTYMK